MVSAMFAAVDWLYSLIPVRFPDLRIVCVEADAGWVPHYMYRMDHAYKRHRNWLQPGVALSRLPSEYFAEHIFARLHDRIMLIRRHQGSIDNVHDSHTPDTLVVLPSKFYLLA